MSVDRAAKKIAKIMDREYPGDLIAQTEALMSCTVKSAVGAGLSTDSLMGLLLLVCAVAGLDVPTGSVPRNPHDQ